MKGLTAQLRDLGAGEQIEVSGVARSDIYKVAKRVGKPVRVAKFIGGFYVTGIGEASIRKDEGAVRPSLPPRKSIDELKALIAGIGNTPKTVEPVDEWAGWSGELQSRDDEAGEVVIYREHFKTKRRQVIRRETAW